MDKDARVQTPPVHLLGIGAGIDNESTPEHRLTGPALPVGPASVYERLPLAHPPLKRNQPGAAIVVGCPVGCNFCSTSAMFGGKGHFVSFYPRADDLFAVMCQLEEAMKIRVFFIMDENFLLQRPRALELLELMRRGEKPWALKARGRHHE